MSQQLHLFGEELTTNARSDSSTNLLLNRTKKLFRHQGSTDELVERIRMAAKAIDEHCA